MPGAAQTRKLYPLQETDFGFNAMELQFTITPEHTEIRIGELLEREMLKHDQQQARLLSYVARLQDRLLAPLLFVLCLAGGMLAIYFPERPLTPQKIISMVLYGVIFMVVWWFFSGRLLRRLQARLAASHAKPRTTFRITNRHLIEIKLRNNLRAAEGAYRLLFDDEGFSLINTKGRGAKGELAWGKIVRLKETPDFYSVASAELDRKGKFYHIPKHSDVMDADQYQKGLKLFLSRVPDSVI
ncbi:YcxB family protein [Pseudomonas sp. P9_31]|uniref:YcxB family protein n=1 Tax=Pseudomonas sp. P9_31 TaxID=3043448 RepID=UPI002A35F49E|nr:YcxB family protein [Pseudomonas sp. P9_31]WPN55495.1 YcxB family protein [Pseudomonas sp. P9_31]